MAGKIEKKTLLFALGTIACLVLAVLFGWHLLQPALDPVVGDMVKIFFCGLGCGLFPGIWIGIKMERKIKKDERELHQDHPSL